MEIDGDCWPDWIGLSNLERKFTCKACGHSVADVREKQLLVPSTPKATLEAIEDQILATKGVLAELEQLIAYQKARNEDP
jgi:hypothetical protein